MTPAYVDVVDRLLACCTEYREHKVGLEGLKAAVWATAREMSNPEERDMHEFLQRAEGRLDMIQFTVDAADVWGASIEVAATIEARLLAYLADGDV